MEYTFKGTPGPWAVDGFNTTAVIAKVNEVGWKHVCNCNYGYDAPEEHIELNTTNAHLIAAAPELLEALVDLNTALDNYWNSHSKPDSLVKAITRQQQKSLAAIHKALNL